MSRPACRYVHQLALILASVICTDGWLSGQSSRPGFVATTKNGEWPHYTADVRGTRYSPLDQINAANFNKLEVAWRFKTDNLGTASRIQARRHAADGQGRALHDRRHAPLGRRARRERPAS